ncbi:MAG: DUF1565 domain-containing protein [Bacteroidales bacterium]|jgi:hypothetical protein|nr:DUF1565 domain-containing protein [Bacteroidales bacterium]
MKQYVILLVLIIFPFFNLIGQIIRIPGDYPTIRQGMEAASEGDTVLVSPGTYKENLEFDGTNLTLASLFLTTQDTSYISATIIDGSSLGSVITVQYYEDAATLISGFSIIHGNGGSDGGGLYIRNASPVLEHLVIRENVAEFGGGICLKSCHPLIRNCRIENNYASVYGGGMACESSAMATLEQVTITANHSGVAGGGIYCFQNNDLSLSGTNITYNHSGVGGGLGWYDPQSITFDTASRCNIYLNSADYYGNDLFSVQGNYEIIVDTFSVMYPTDFHADERQKFTFDIMAGKIEQADAGLYVSPSGDDANTGLTPEDPLKTIRSAFSRLRAGPGHINTVHLANGTYSPSTGQQFPLYLVNQSCLAGESTGQTILDAEGAGSVIIMEFDTIPLIEKLTVTGGNDSRGGGIYSMYSEFHGQELIVTGNSGANSGGGLYISNNNNSSLVNSIVENNTSVDGGGVHAEVSGIDMQSVDFTNNLASLYGGGISLKYCDTAFLSWLRFSGNQAYSMGGGLYALRTSNFIIRSSEFDSNIAADGGGVHSRYSSPVISNSLFSNNTGVHTGSGIELYHDYETDSAGMESRIINVTFANNTSPALFCYDAGVSVINNIFWGNAGPYQVQLQGSDTVTDTLRVLHSTIQDGMDGIGITGPAEIVWLEGNIDSDPLFMEAGTDPFALGPGSPCIDSGTPDTTGLLLPYNDIIGNTRVWDGDGNGSNIIDMGAYEYGAPVSLPESELFLPNSSGKAIVYPNPARDQVTVRWLDPHGKLFVSLLNSTGFCLHSYILSSGRETLLIDLKPFGPGIYFILTIDETGVCRHEKLVLSK